MGSQAWQGMAEPMGTRAVAWRRWRGKQDCLVAALALRQAGRACWGQTCQSATKQFAQARNERRRQRARRRAADKAMQDACVARRAASGGALHIMKGVRDPNRETRTQSWRGAYHFPSSAATRYVSTTSAAAGSCSATCNRMKRPQIKSARIIRDSYITITGPGNAIYMPALGGAGVKGRTVTLCCGLANAPTTTLVGTADGSAGAPSPVSAVASHEAGHAAYCASSGIPPNVAPCALINSRWKKCPPLLLSSSCTLWLSAEGSKTCSESSSLSISDYRIIIIIRSKATKTPHKPSQCTSRTTRHRSGASASSVPRA